MNSPRYRTTPMPADRLRTLADGIFAIVMTILVLELGVPIVTEGIGENSLSHALLEMWPEFLIYGLSFLVLGMFWIIHHMLFDSIKYYDTTLSWLNIVLLMFTALIPFSTALFGEYGATQITATVYGINMLLIFGMSWTLWYYSTRNNRLRIEDIDPNIVKGGNKMGLVYVLLISSGVILSFVNPVVSFLIYGFIVIGFISLTILGRWEAATIWPAGIHKK